MRTPLPRTRRLRSIAVFVALLATMALSLPSYRLIPGRGRAITGWPFTWGLDLFNVYAFQTCAERDHPYLWTGSQCGDPLGRAMPYPPLLYWSFAWMRAVSFPTARAVWAVVLVAIFATAAVVWASLGRPSDRTGDRARTVIFGLALCTQFPAVFAVERGNNDAVVVAIWTVATVLFVRGRSAGAGVAAGVAAAAKIYPLFACAIVFVGLCADVVRRKRIAPALRWAAGFALIIALDATLLWADTVAYAKTVLPAFAAHLPAASLHSHSVPATFGSCAPIVSAAVLAAWTVASARRLHDRPVDVLAGALAVSTFVARVSFDYNLVTAYPLLVVQAARCFADRSDRLVAAGVLALGVLAIVAHRGWFGEHAVLHGTLQVAWLLASAVAAFRTEPLVTASGAARTSRS